jgi:hypothetical protein
MQYMSMKIIKALLVLVTLFVLISLGLFFMYSQKINSDIRDNTNANNNSLSKNNQSISNIKLARWSKNVKVSIDNQKITIKSNNIPNHARQNKYAQIKDNYKTISESNLEVMNDTTKEQNYSFDIPLSPTKANKSTTISNNVVGIMISGAELFGPFETSNQQSVMTESKLAIKDIGGININYIDNCNGHPTKEGVYHYHSLSSCNTGLIDKEGGPSHIIGVALDGFAIYGDKDIDGNKISPESVDECNGLLSRTPEFPQGVYHYVIFDNQNSSSSLKCLSGVI